MGRETRGGPGGGPGGSGGRRGGRDGRARIGALGGIAAAAFSRELGPHPPARRRLGHGPPGGGPEPVHPAFAAVAASPIARDAAQDGPGAGIAAAWHVALGGIAGAAFRRELSRHPAAGLGLRQGPPVGGLEPTYPASAAVAAGGVAGDPGQLGRGAGGASAGRVLEVASLLPLPEMARRGGGLPAGAGPGGHRRQEQDAEGIARGRHSYRGSSFLMSGMARARARSSSFPFWDPVKMWLGSF